MAGTPDFQLNLNSSPTSNPMLKKIAQFVIGFVVFAVAIAGPLYLVKKSQFAVMGAAMAGMVMPPTTVTATEATESQWENVIVGTGTLVAVQGVTVGAEAPGKVTKITFEAGATVQAGDLLVQLDTTTEQAQLRAAEANAAFAQANLVRARGLRENNTNAPAELDAADAQAKQAEAQADNIRAIIAKKTIRAPFAGRLGLRLVNLGQVLKDNDPIATLQTLDPIYVNFSLPQQRLPQLATGNQVRITGDAAPGKLFDGKITAISPEIDPATRNVRIQATISNSGETLRPGMFVKVDVVLPAENKVLAIPATAIAYAPYGDSVFVIDEKKDESSGKVQKVLRQQFVRLGETRGDFVSVVDGLKPGESVVTSGIFKLRAGTPVVIDNTLAPHAELNPKPKNS
jgi:membrane fusion protein (multidrug efflux system)